MWYTHYWFDIKEIEPETNNLYKRLLNAILVDGERSLYDVRLENIIKKEGKAIELWRDEEMEENFHEVSWTSDYLPVLSTDFCKTARKRYDLAVAIAIAYQWSLFWQPVSSDASWSELSELVVAMQNKNTVEIEKLIRSYVKTEGIDGITNEDILRCKAEVIKSLEKTEYWNF